MDAGRAIEVLPDRYAVCRLPAGSGLPWWAAGSDSFLGATFTATEVSVVCEASRVPGEVRTAGVYRALRVDGPIPPDEVGVLVRLATPLAGAGVALFALATFDTDYLLVAEDQLARGIEALRAAGVVVR